VLCAIALVIIVAPSATIIVNVIAHAAPVLRLNLLTSTTINGNLGLQNAITGTLVLSLGVLVVAGPVGILSGVYIAEFAPRRFGGALRFFSEVLAGVPSIVIGYVGYVLLVNDLHWGFSLLGGILALSVLIIPYIVKITEVSFAQVPHSLREAAMAVGLTRLTTIRKILLPPALPGIVSGLVLALAISTGETAPLLFTAGFSDANPNSLFHNGVGYLTYVTYTDVSLPSAGAQALASASAAVTIILILFLILGGRLITVRARRMVARLDV
jgi:phosphate transport system permease protein